jgi:hypothetical protein
MIFYPLQKLTKIHSRKKFQAPQILSIAKVHKPFQMFANSTLFFYKFFLMLFMQEKKIAHNSSSQKTQKKKKVIYNFFKMLSDKFNHKAADVK